MDIQSIEQSVKNRNEENNKVILGQTAGFCAGVRNAVEKAIIETEENKGTITYCLGDLVHNPQVMERLEQNGLKVINFLTEVTEPEGKKIIFRAHGVTKETYEQAEKLGLQILDLTCPKVLAIHKLAEQYAENDYHILLIGEKEHPEVIGTASFCGRKFDIIETDKDLEQILLKIKKEDISKILVISQTTFNLEKFELFVQKIKEGLSIIPTIEIKNTICNATRIRQEETEKLAKSVEYMIVIGGRKSSNTNKLYDISSRNCQNAVMIENKEELSKNLLKKIQECNKIGIMAGASTPQDSILEITNIIQDKKS